MRDENEMIYLSSSIRLIQAVTLNQVVMSLRHYNESGTAGISRLFFSLFMEITRKGLFFCPKIRFLKGIGFMHFYTSLLIKRRIGCSKRKVEISEVHPPYFIHS